MNFYVDRIVRIHVHVSEFAKDTIGQELNGSLDDLTRLQRVLDFGAFDKDDTLTLQCLGLALGKITVKNNQGYDPWMVEDHNDRNPCVCYEETLLLTYPQNVLAKRVEKGVVFVDKAPGIVRHALDRRIHNLFPEVRTRLYDPFDSHRRASLYVRTQPNDEHMPKSPFRLWQITPSARSKVTTRAGEGKWATSLLATIYKDMFIFAC